MPSKLLIAAASAAQAARRASSFGIVTNLDMQRPVLLKGRTKVCMTNAAIGRIYVGLKAGRLLFAKLVGPSVEHSAHLLAWAITQGLTASDLLAMPFYYPTYEEGPKPAVRKFAKPLARKDHPIAMTAFCQASDHKAWTQSNPSLASATRTPGRAETRSK